MLTIQIYMIFLVEFGELTGHPILANTSLNGPGEPIVETPEDALDFFLSHPDVDALLLSGILVRRVSNTFHEPIKLAPDTIIALIYPQGARRIILVRRNSSMEISPSTFERIQAQQEMLPRRHGDPDCSVDPHLERELFEAMCLGLVVQGWP
jgi:carbamoyltransferase